MATLTITDRADGTGTDATVAGFDAGETVTLAAQRVNGDLGGRDWVVVDSRTGDGALPAAVAVGYYWWSAVGSTGRLANLVYQPATDGVAALHDRIMDGVVGQMELLALVGLRPGIDETGGIVRHKIPDKPRLTLPCCVVTTYNLAESMLGGTTGNDHVGYPVSLSFLSRDPFDFTKEGRVLRWRQQVSRTFRVQRLPGVREVWACAIEPGPVFQYEPRVVEYQISAMTLRFTTREPRGFGV